MRGMFLAISPIDQPEDGPLIYVRAAAVDTVNNYQHRGYVNVALTFRSGRSVNARSVRFVAHGEASEPVTDAAEIVQALLHVDDVEADQVRDDVDEGPTMSPAQP